MANVYEVPDALGLLTADVRIECVQAKRQWEALGKAGGQRDDHAAQLLIGVARQLRTLADTANAMADQIVALQADPFGD